MTKVWRRACESLHKEWPSYGVIALGALIGCFLATQPLSFFIASLLPDDAFYYFQIARSISEGVGSTFDGIHPTNGYHPLWLVILLPIFHLFSVGGVEDTAPIYAALGLSVLLNIGTAVFVLRIVSRLTESAALRALSVFLWVMNPFVIFETLNGLETSLALFFLSLFMLLALRASEQDRGYLLVGAVGGLLMLARLDMLFYVGAFYLWLMVRHGVVGGLRRGVPAGLVSAVVVAPWFIWNYATFYMLGTSASHGNPLVNHTLIVQDNGASLFQAVKAVFYSLVTYGNGVLERTGAPWLVFALVGAAAALVATGKVVVARSREHLPLLAFLFLGFALLFLVNAGIRFTGRNWYFISFNLFVVFGTAWVLSKAVVGERVRRFAAGGIGLIALSTFFIGWYSELRNANEGQIVMYEMAGWMNEHLPPATVVGVFNAGVQAYFSDVRVVNLDGLVNNSAYEAMRDHRLWSYVREENIEYISDFDLYLTYRYKSFLDIEDPFSELTELHRISIANGPHGADGIALYKLIEGSE